MEKCIAQNRLGNQDFLEGLCRAEMRDVFFSFFNVIEVLKMCQILGHFSFSFLSWIIEYNVLEGQLELVQSDKKMVVHGRRGGTPPRWTFGCRLLELVLARDSKLNNKLEKSSN